MPNNEKAKKLAAAKKKLKAYQSSAVSNLPQVEKESTQSVINLKNELRDDIAAMNVSENEASVQQYSDNKVVEFKTAPNSDHSVTAAFQTQIVSDSQENGYKNSQPTSLQNYFDTTSNSFLSFFSQQPEQQSQIELSSKNSEILNKNYFSTAAIPQQEQNLNSASGASTHSVSNPTESFFDTLAPLQASNHEHNTLAINVDKPENIKTIELLIAEKSNLSTELTNFKTLCKEKEFEIEELQIRLQSAKNQIEDLEKHFFVEQKKATEFQKKFKSYEVERSNEATELNDFKEHLNELKHELAIERNKNSDLENQIREKNNELELNAIRINQISDETSITIDNRIEKLTQTKFMYEQQIIDLQAIIQQFRAEKESNNQQYQSYVQNLNKDISSLSEKNSELLDENTKLKSRETDLIHHISGLEKQIQQNIARNESLRDIQKNTTLEQDNQKINEIEEKLKVAETLKLNLEQEVVVKSAAAVENKKLLDISSQKIAELEELLRNITSDRPNDSKLLAQIESDKVAASRAMIQNAELRKQLDELQLKLIDLVNDKADLTNKLDSEMHANKEIRSNYENFEQQIQSLTEKLHYKDEEMIRLSHENVLLNEKINDLNSRRVKNNDANCNEDEHHHGHDHHNHDHHNHDHHNHDHHNHDHHNHDCENSEKSSLLNGSFNEKDDNIGENQTIEIAKEALNSSRKSSASTILPTNEAMQKLEQRFTRLMGEVADLTDEKQRLEHLVLQLQGETETIGEYIALYQTQRRQLKQKEIEKDTQLYRLKAEREELKENLSKLNNLIGRLGLNPVSINTHLHNALTGNLTNGSENSENVQSTQNLISNPNNLESKKIINQIHTLITEIKDKEDSLLNSTIVDHCACCQGTLETI